MFCVMKAKLLGVEDLKNLDQCKFKNIMNLVASDNIEKLVA